MVDDVQVLLTKKHVKNINLRVKSPEGQVRVSAPLWVNTATVEAFVREKMGWIRDKQQSLAHSPRADARIMSAEELAQAKKYIEASSKPLVHTWEAIIGVKAQTLAYRNMTSRWGSCNPATGRICLNIQLVNYPPACLEYVVVHELCHLLERGHGPQFKALMDKHLPDWRERKALLK